MPGGDPARLQRLHPLHVDVSEDPDGVDVPGPVRDLLPHLDGHVGCLEGPEEGDGAGVGESVTLGVLEEEEGFLGPSLDGAADALLGRLLKPKSEGFV